MRNIAGIFICLSLSTNAEISFAGTKNQEMVMVCPQTVVIEENVVSKHPGWKVSRYKKSRHKEHKSNLLGFVSENNGNIELLAPTNYMPLPDTGGPGISTWTFTPQMNIFLLCHVPDTDVILLRRPPEGSHQCTIRTDDSIQRAVCE